MAKEVRQNRTYNGSMTGSLDVAGYLFNKVTVNGSLAVRGDMDCNGLLINGSFSDRGTLKTKNGTVNGEAVIHGGLDSARIKVNGQLRVDGDARVKDLSLNGMARVDGGLTSERVRLRGNIDVKKDCTAESFDSKGVFVIGGLLNSSVIRARIYCECSAKEIGGDKIEIKRVPWTLFNRFLSYMAPGMDFAGHLATDTIEGDEIYVEYTSAKTIRGGSVTIGKGCDIGLVEYKNSFAQDKSSQVKEHVKTGI